MTWSQKAMNQDLTPGAITGVPNLKSVMELHDEIKNAELRVRAEPEAWATECNYYKLNVAPLYCEQN